MGELIFDEAGLAALLDSPAGEVGQMLLTLGIYIEGHAKSICPVDTGRLRSSIDHQLGSDGASLFVRVGTDVEYAAYVELGTRRMSAQPYLTPALYAGIAKVAR